MQNIFLYMNPCRQHGATAILNGRFMTAYGRPLAASAGLGSNSQQQWYSYRGDSFVVVYDVGGHWQHFEAGGESMPVIAAGRWQHDEAWHLYYGPRATPLSLGAILAATGSIIRSGRSCQ